MLQLLIALAFLVLVFSYRDYPQIIARGVARERALVAGDAAYLAGNFSAAEGLYRQGLAAQPDFVDAQVTLALALAAQQRDTEAQGLVTSDKARGLSRRADLVAGALLRTVGRADAARKRLALVETNAGEDIQRWALTWLRPDPTAALPVGAGLDLGYLQGFSPAETDAGGQSFRWLEGQGALRLVLPAPPAPGAALELLISGGPQDTALTLRFPDGSTRRIIVRGGQWRRYRVPLPSALPASSELRVQLSAPTFIPARQDPASADARTLSLMLAEVRVQ